MKFYINNTAQFYIVKHYMKITGRRSTQGRHIIFIDKIGS
jgi:hypothetical protein